MMQAHATLGWLGILSLTWAAPQTVEADSGEVVRGGDIMGVVWNDANGNGVIDPDENLLDGITVYLDANDNRMLDVGELSTKTGQTGWYGRYAFAGVPSGTHRVRQVVPFGQRNTVASVRPTPLDPKSERYQHIQIIGGDLTKPREYPFMVAVDNSPTAAGKFRRYCGGNLVTDRWVVTAAHCSEGLPDRTRGVIVGTNDATNGSGTFHAAKSITLHPRYLTEPPEPGAPYSVWAGFDIALWELHEPVKLVEGVVETIGMLSNEQADLAETDILATAIGWGVTDSGVSSRRLRDVHVPIVDPQTCQSVYSAAINFDTQICAGAIEGGIDSCQGDSGGPLVVRHQGRWLLAGVTSYGNGCARANYPGVYARVSRLSSWVREAGREPSRTHVVTISPYGVAFAPFGNRSTRLEPERTIEPRWQLVNLSGTPSVKSFFEMSWQIIDEAPFDRSFDCKIDVDGIGPLVPEAVACGRGSNTASFAPLADGVYITTLSARGGGTRFTRNPANVVGSPPVAQISGELTPEDAVDPDYASGSRVFFIDYFDLDGLSGSKSILVEVKTAGFDPFIALYDRKVRETQGRGGRIGAPAIALAPDPARKFANPEPGINYVLGVSTLRRGDVGTYTVTVMNEGTPVATTLAAVPPAPPAPTAASLRKITGRNGDIVRIPRPWSMKQDRRKKTAE